MLFVADVVVGLVLVVDVFLNYWRWWCRWCWILLFVVVDVAVGGGNGVCGVGSGQGHGNDSSNNNTKSFYLFSNHPITHLTN